MYDATKFPPATRVNGAFLSNYIGKQIVMIGTVMQVHPSGRSLELKTSDDRVVTVNINQPLEDTLKGLIEVQGVGTGKNVMKGELFTEFPEEISENFDMAGYNESINIIHTISNPWKCD